MRLGTPTLLHANNPSDKRPHGELSLVLIDGHSIEFCRSEFKPVGHKGTQNLSRLLHIGTEQTAPVNQPCTQFLLKMCDIRILKLAHSVQRCQLVGEPLLPLRGFATP